MKFKIIIEGNINIQDGFVAGELLAELVGILRAEAQAKHSASYLKIDFPAIIELPESNYGTTSEAKIAARRREKTQV